MTPEQHTALKEAVAEAEGHRYEDIDMIGLCESHPLCVCLSNVGIDLLGPSQKMQAVPVKAVLKIARLLLLVEDVARAEKAMKETAEMGANYEIALNSTFCFHGALNSLLDFHRQVTGE